MPLTKFAFAAFVLLVSGGISAAQTNCTPGSPSCQALPSNKQVKADPLDAKRKADIRSLQVALEGYAKKNAGSYLVKGSGAGGAGVGAVTQQYNGVPSVLDALFAEGFIKSKILADPTGVYLLYLCDGNKRYSLSANLKNPSPAEIAKAQTTCNALGVNGTYSNYKMNYAVGN